MKQYIVCYREKYKKESEEYNYSVICKSKKEVKKNFEVWENQHKKWVITKIEKIL